MNRERPSNELLNAFVDGELCAEERLAYLRQIADDAAHGHEVCEQCQLKEMVRLAYQEPPAPPPRQPRATPPANSGWRGNAAIVAMLLLLVAGMVAITLDSEPPLTPLADSSYLENRIVLHLTTAEPARVANMLDEIELLMENARRHDIALQIEVIANGEGLALLRTDTSPAPQRIALLARRHAQGLRFAACQNSIERLQREENIRVQLLPAAQLVDSGIVEVVRRQREGWAYIQI